MNKNLYPFAALITLMFLSFTTKAQNDLLLQTSEVNNLMVHFAEDEGSLERFYVIPNTAERRDRLKSIYSDYLTQLDKLPFDNISTGGKVDYLLFKRDIESKLYQLGIEERECNQVSKLTSPGNPIYELEKQRRRGHQLNASEVAEQLNSVNSQLQQAILSLDKQPDMTRALVARAKGTILGQQKALRSVYDFYNGYDPEFTWWAAEPTKKLDSTLSKYASLVSKKIDQATLPKDDGSGIIGFPIGRDELVRLLQYEMIPYTPEELIEIANKEFAWCDTELLKATKEMGFGNDWQKAQEKVKQSYVPAGKQPDAMMDLYNQSIAFLKEHDMITIPPIAEESWRMIMMTPERQLINPFFTGGETFSISYPTNTMTHEDKLMSMRGNNPHFSRATVHHEIIAGHHLQRFMNNRYKSYRNFRTPFWTEGWALYMELTLWDMNFPRSPEDRIGMLFWRMHRCARIIFSLNYHLGKWMPQQCIDFLVDRVGFERANAEGEVRRSFTTHYGPLYQLAYMTGGLQFYALRKELVDGDKMTMKQFHDAVMHENSMPVEMVRAILTDQPLKKNFKTSWKFYKK